MNTSYLISIAYFGFNDTMNTLIQTAYDLIESFDSEVGEQNGSYWRVATKYVALSTLKVDRFISFDLYIFKLLYMLVRWKQHSTKPLIRKKLILIRQV